MIRKVAYYAILVWSASGCVPRPGESTLHALHIDSLLNAQAATLSQHRVSLYKSAAIGEGSSDTTWIPSEAQWKTELKSFNELGLVNKRLYKDVYRIEDPVEDKRSNLRIRRYTSTQAPLASLDIFYLGEVARFRRLEGILHQANKLYAAHRTLTLVFDEVQGKPLLTHYRIVGYQKLALRDTIHFTIEGVINW